MKKSLYVYICIVLFAVSGFAQSNVNKPTILKPTYFDVSPPLRDMVQNPNAKVDMT